MKIHPVKMNIPNIGNIVILKKHFFLRMNLEKLLLQSTNKNLEHMIKQFNDMSIIVIISLK